MRGSISRIQVFAYVGMAAAAAAMVAVACGDTGAPQQMPPKGGVKIEVAQAAGGLDTPLDATPDPNGVAIYYIAKDASGPAVFQIAQVGAQPHMLYAGAPLVAPRGITTSSDGKTLYIADPSGGADGKGVIWSMPSAGDTPVPLDATAGLHPTALDVDEDGTAEDLYFTGTDANGSAAVFKLVLGSAGPATTLASGAPLAMPDGIAVATDGTVYVSDAQGGMKLPGQVFKVAGGKAVAFGPEFQPGTPAGLTITMDDAKLLASSLDPASGTSQVVIIQTKDAMSSTFNDVIKQNSVSGGIHRARVKDIYAWAGKTSVYSIKISPLRYDGSTPGGPSN